MRPTAQQVWEATIQDSKFAEQAPEGSPVREALRPFVEASVEVLDELLETTVSLQVIADAKMRFLRHCVEYDIGKIMGDVMGFGGDMFTSLFEQIIDMLEPLVKDIAAFFEEHGVTEEQVMLSDKVGLNAENQAKWRTGTLTLGELLLTQPGVILQNDS